MRNATDGRDVETRNINSHKCKVATVKLALLTALFFKVLHLNVFSVLRLTYYFETYKFLFLNI